MRKTNGFSLLELVIAVSVLVILAGVMVDLVAHAQDQTAYDTTIKRMDQIKEALHAYSLETIKARIADGSSSVKDFGLIHNNDCELKSVATMTGGGSYPRNVILNYLPAGGSTGVESQVFLDGWGKPFRYQSVVDASDTSAQQTKAYLWSTGPDQEPQFVNGGVVSLAKAEDDIIVFLDFTEEFNNEALRRTSVINSALKRYMSNPGLIGNIVNPGYLLGDPTIITQGSPYAGQTLFSYRGKYSVELQMYGPEGFNMVYEDLTLSTPPLLPTDERYLYSPWLLFDTKKGGYRPVVNEWPVAQVEFMRPAATP